MKTQCRLGLVAGLAGVLWATPTLAVSLGFVPVAQTVGPGDSLTVDLVVSDLGPGGAPSLGAFDLDVSFDPLVLAPSGVTFGPFLGDEALLEVLSDFTFSTGVVDLAAVSLLSPGELDSLQPASFTLATLAFDALGAGTSPLSFTQALLGDAFGADLVADAAAGSVTVTGAAATPLPSPLLLLGAGVAVWALQLRGRPSR